MSMNKKINIQFYLFTTNSEVILEYSPAVSPGESSPLVGWCWSSCGASTPSSSWLSRTVWCPTSQWPHSSPSCSSSADSCSRLLWRSSQWRHTWRLRESRDYINRGISNLCIVCSMMYSCFWTKNECWTNKSKYNAWSWFSQIINTSGYAASPRRNSRFATATLHIFKKMGKFYFFLNTAHLDMRILRTWSA